MSTMSEWEKEQSKNDYLRSVAIISLSLLIIFLIVGGAWGCPTYNVWEQELVGTAELKRAEQNRKIKVQEAMAQEEASKSLAQAEIIRARGVAEANAIIGKSLEGNESYLRYLWIHNLEVAEKSGSQVIYVPTEGNLPILEAGKRKDQSK